MIFGEFSVLKFDGIVPHFHNSCPTHTDRRTMVNGATVEPSVKTAAAVKMDELLVAWLGSDTVYHNALEWIENCKTQDQHHSNVVSQIKSLSSPSSTPVGSPTNTATAPSVPSLTENSSNIPPFYPVGQQYKVRRLVASPRPAAWEGDAGPAAHQIFLEAGTQTADQRKACLGMDSFVRITKEVCRFPSYFNSLLYQRVLDVTQQPAGKDSVVTLDMLEQFWMQEMEHFDTNDRFFRLIKQPDAEAIVRDDFLPILKALLTDHPGLEFLSSHEEFQEKYAVSVVTRIFYHVDRAHSGKISARELRHSDLVEVFQLVDEEEDINKIARYFSYEHFYGEWMAHMPTVLCMG